jgi:hypothetical protein
MTRHRDARPSRAYARTLAALFGSPREGRVEEQLDLFGRTPEPLRVTPSRDADPAPPSTTSGAGTIHVEHATPRTTVEASASTLATRGGGSSSAPTSRNGETR